MVDLREHIKYMQSQDNVGCCTASAVLLAAEMLSAKAGKPLNLSRLFVYYMTRKLQGRIGQKGAELKSTFDALSMYGACKEQFWPFSPHRVDNEPSPRAVQNAQYKINAYENINPSDFNSMLDRGIPVVIGMHTGRLFWSMRGELHEQVYKPVNENDNRPAQGHAVTIVGYDEKIQNGSWIIANSLGLRWGYRGCGILPYSCYADIGESYVIRNFAGISAE
jgi:C1A family cysteine protease